MAISKAKKQEQVEAIAQLLANSKLTVAASYPGVPVKAMQQLRRDAKAKGAVVKVVKNRLFYRALADNKRFENVGSALTGQLLYVFSDQDEIVPAQVVAEFAKSGQPLEFVAGYTADGKTLAAVDLQALADLPSKDQLRAQAVAIMSAPLTGFVGVMSGNLRGMLQVLRSRAEQLNA